MNAYRINLWVSIDPTREGHLHHLLLEETEFLPRRIKIIVAIYMQKKNKKDTIDNINNS